MVSIYVKENFTVKSDYLFIFIKGELLYNVGLVKELIPREIDKKSGVPEKERGLGFSRRRKGQTFFSTFLSLSHIKLFFFSFKPGTDDYTTQFKLCTSDYITTMYPA